MEKEKTNPLKSFGLTDLVMVRIFFAALLIMAVVALIPVLRPEYSESEKRELKKFPEFKLSALISGEYFDDVNLWYADTFPFRDKLVNLNNLFIGSLNIDSSVEIHGDLSVGDDIPDVSQKEETTTKDDTTTTESETSSEKADSSVQEPASQQQTPQTSQPPPTPPVVNTSETLGAIVRIGDSAFEYYDFVQRIADEYASHISYAADSLVGKANVYAIIAPTSMGITLPDDIAASVNSSDQKRAMEYLYGSMSANVVKVNPFNTLKKHKNEYIYFRTDHHWTSLGAYYAYCELMKVKGIAPPDLNVFIKHEFGGYLGSFYNQTKSPYLKGNPDTVVAFEPPWTNTIKTTLDVNTILDKKIVSDGNALNQGSKYLCFVSGDRPYGVISNPALADGSSCLLIKESFGNAMVPFFVANYQTVHVIDYRYFSLVDVRKLSQFVTDNNIGDVVFVNNISATRNSALVNMIGQFVRE